MKLLIDDAKEGGWADIVARNAAAGIMILGTCEGNIEELYIDYDLGSGPSGLFVLQSAIDNEITLPDKIIIVSLNPPGRTAIENFLLDNNFVRSHAEDCFLKCE